MGSGSIPSAPCTSGRLQADKTTKAKELKEQHKTVIDVIRGFCI
jgi:hypothetical protein